jgi:hypothetical protein
MKKIFLLLPILLLSLAVSPAEAHFLDTDGSIGAVLHIDPNDTPTANSQATFFFEFKDKDNLFQIENCDCIFEVEQNGKTIYSQPLSRISTKSNEANASISYTFPKRDIYTVRIIGKPLTANDFSPFSLSWELRIDKEASPQQQTQPKASLFSSSSIPIVLISVLIIGIFTYFVSGKHPSKKNTKKGGDQDEENHYKRY